MIRVSEIEAELTLVLDLPILMKLGSMVSGNRLESSRVAADQSPGLLVQRPCGSVLELPDHEKACFSLHQGHDAVGGAFSHDRIDLPVAAVATAFHASGALGNMTLSGHAASAVIGSVALPPQFRRLPEVGP